MTTRPVLPNLMRIRHYIFVAILPALLILPQIVNVDNASAQTETPIVFRQAAEPGFGDPQNSGAWSMQWWNGHLYVGTVRSWFCWSQAWFNMNIPLIPYPPETPNFDCAADPVDLPLQAEIWRYTPETNQWDRVYQAPLDVEIPGHEGKFTGRDVGYRGMTIFEEPDGTEALYVSGVTINALWPQLPPPRILRSVDGTNFAPLPQDPGTVLGDLGFSQGIFRSILSHDGRLYVLNGKVRGEGWILESDNPAMGNDTFRWITPQDMQVFEMVSFNGYLYLGVVGETGYSVIKVDTSGELPYEFAPVVTNGAYLKPFPSRSVVSMHVFQNTLYVGTNSPTELIRIYPDDSWDLIVGQPREAPDGWKFPLSGFDAGFDWPMNVHLWRMQEHDGALYAGTLDQSTRLRVLPGISERYRWQFGFDLYRSVDGERFEPITVNGLGNPYQMGIRTFASTPKGLFAGTVSYWEGLQILHLREANSRTRRLPSNRVFVPAIVDNGVAISNQDIPAEAEEIEVDALKATSSVSDDVVFTEHLLPLYLETVDGRNLLVWDSVLDAETYRIYRAENVGPLPSGCDGNQLLVSAPTEQGATCALAQNGSDMPVLDYYSTIGNSPFSEKLSYLFDKMNAANWFQVTNAYLNLDIQTLIADSSWPYLLSELGNISAQVNGSYVDLGTTNRLVYVDSTLNPDQTYRYYVVAEGKALSSINSTLARSPSVAPIATFSQIEERMSKWQHLKQRDTELASGIAENTKLLQGARIAIAASDWQTGINLVIQVRTKVASETISGISASKKRELSLMLLWLSQRIRLAEENLLDPTSLN